MCYSNTKPDYKNTKRFFVYKQTCCVSSPTIPFYCLYILCKHPTKHTYTPNTYTSFKSNPSFYTTKVVYCFNIKKKRKENRSKCGMIHGTKLKRKIKISNRSINIFVFFLFYGEWSVSRYHAIHIKKNNNCNNQTKKKKIPFSTITISMKHEKSKKKIILFSRYVNFTI